MTHAQAERQHREQKRALGVCVHHGCHKRAAKGRVRCTGHLEAQRRAKAKAAPEISTPKRRTKGGTPR